MKILINNCYGGFGFSALFMVKYYALKGIKVFAYKMGYDNNYRDKIFTPVTIEQLEDTEKYGSHSVDIYRTDKAHELNEKQRHKFLVYGGISRDDKIAVQLAIELGSKANGECAEIEVEEITDGLNYSIGEYDGQEWIQDTWINVTYDELAKGLSKEQLALALKAGSIHMIENRS